MDVLPVHMYVYHIGAPWIPWNEAEDSYKLPCVCWHLNPSLLRYYQLLLTLKPSLQLHLITFSLCICGSWWWRGCRYMCQSEHSLWELVLSFYHVGPGIWTQVVRLSSRNLFICLAIYPGSLSLMTINMTWGGEHLNVALICFSPVPNEAEHLFTFI